MSCYWRMLKISWTEHRTNESVLKEMGTRNCEKKKTTVLRTRSQSTKSVHPHITRIRRRQNE